MRPGLQRTKTGIRQFDLTMLKKNCSLVGRIRKPHGINGQFIISLNRDISGEFNLKEFLFLRIDGTMIPFSIRNAEVFPDEMVVNVEFIDNPEDVKRFSGTEVFFTKSVKHKRRLASHLSIAGYKIIDEKSGLTGIITGILDIPLNPLIEVESGKSKYLIPFQEDFIIKSDNRKKLIIMKLPEGFADLN